MPQLDSTTFASQLFWLVVFFSILFVFSAKVTLPRLENVFHERWQKIEGTREAALHIQQEAEQLARHIQQELENARQRAHQQIIETSRTLSREQAQQKQEFAQYIKQRLREHEVHLTQQRISSLQEVQLAAQELTALILRQVIDNGGDPLSPVVKKAVETSIERNKAVNDG
jgi:F-type H+-transporting ATPase subunit b